jgi:hypothetical protein
VQWIRIASSHHVPLSPSQAFASITRGHHSSRNGKEEGQSPLQCAMDWIRTRAESSSIEEEDGKLCTRRQMSRYSQLASTFPSLPTHAMLEKGSGATLDDFTPQPTPSMTGGGGTCLMTRVNQQVTQGNKVEHPTAVARSALESCHFGNRGSKCLGAQDACCARTSHYHLKNHCHSTLLSMTHPI